MNGKEITIVLYGRRFANPEWRFDMDESRIDAFFGRMEEEFGRYGIIVRHGRDENIVLDVKGYGDLLNTVRIRSPQDSIANLCLGHIIGPSPHRDFFEDIRRGISRVAFAPETIEPEGSSKIVCHNCGCGC